MTRAELIDKSEWNDGPWQTEPDRWEGEHLGFPLLAVRHPSSGHWCGYAAVPPGHPWHGKELDCGGDGPSIHGGVTYSGACSGHICHVPRPGEPDNVWWLGFDAAHSGDYSPSNAKYAKGRTDGLFDQGDDEYRTLEYIQAECRSLAEQMKAAS